MEKADLRRALVHALDEALIFVKLPDGRSAYLLHPMRAKDMPSLAEFLLRAMKA